MLVMDAWLRSSQLTAQDRQLVLGVVLNLLPDSPNSNTLSLFVNGVRMGKPQALPEELKDKTLCLGWSANKITIHLRPPWTSLWFGGSPEWGVLKVC